MEIRKSLAKQPIAYTWMSQEVRKWFVHEYGLQPYKWDILG